ncbi:MAG: TIGR03960 family B12-binding radical SAM protein [Pseudomonadota bacterium]
MKPETIELKLEQILPRVEKPARYVGGEFNQVVKDWQNTPMRMALAFPDIYDLGMSNLGLAILYDIVNKQEDVLAERVYMPWPDMESAMHEAGLPLFSLETKHKIRDFDILGFSLPHESLYTNMLSMLDLAGISLTTQERAHDDPVVICGGHATFNPEPMADFVDAFVIGEGEDVVLELARCVYNWKNSGMSRTLLWQELARIEGVYVPSLYRVTYHEDGTVERIESLVPDAPLPVRKRIVPKLPLPVTRFIVPNLEVVHNRASFEIMRGCTRGCRFCQAGLITRPVRERPVNEILQAIEDSLDATGFEEIGLLSLSSSDYSAVLELMQSVVKKFADRDVRISLPSLRVESFSVELMGVLFDKSRRSGCTFAPEAATEKLWQIINKPMSREAVVKTSRDVFQRGWHTVKVYFMIGHPSETLEDVKAIADLCKEILAVGRKEIGNRAKIHINVGTFVPKPHTTFQWVACDTVEHVEAKQALLKREIRGRGTKLNWTSFHETQLESWLSRGDRRLGGVILGAWKRGARFDAWQEHFRYDLWMEAFKESNLDPAFYAHRQRELDEILPWEHIDSGVNKEFLLEDYQWSIEGRIRPDCREECFSCGILSKFKEMRRQHFGDIWECPEVGRAEGKTKQNGN